MKSERNKPPLGSPAAHTYPFDHSQRDSLILYYVEHFSAARRLKQIAIQQFLRDRG